MLSKTDEFLLYGSLADYESFILFVKREIAPYMQLELKIEDYLPELYQEFREHQYTAEQIHRGAGKAQSLDSCALTPKGWVKFRDLKEGDEIFCGNGKITKIKWLHEIKKRKIYEVTTSDGRKAQCHDGHLWVVTRPTRTRKKRRVLKLSQIMENYYDERIDKRYNRKYKEYTYYIPNPKPIQFKEKDLLIDPYTLGYWLGDGSSYDARITTDDPEILDYIPYKNVTKLKDKYVYFIKGLQKDLRKLQLIPKNKHIPEEYLIGSVKQRTELLQGLIDSDGHITARKGSYIIEFSNKNERLIDDVVKLVRSLGGTAKKKKRKTSCNGKIFDSFRISILLPPEIIPSKLKRKRKNFNGKENLQNAIVDIRYIKEDLTRCITVEDPEATYITDDYLMTHNTELGIWLTIFYAVCIPINPFSGKRIQEQVIITAAGEALALLNARIKHFFYENPNLRKYIPEGITNKERKNDYWNSKEMYLTNGSIIHFRQINSRSIRGLHPDRVWGDDLVGDNSAIVDKDIESKWFGAVHGTTTAKNAIVDVTGTPRRFTDVMFLMKENKAYFFKARPIINTDGSVLSNKRWTKEKAEKVKEVIGSVIWACEYLLNPIDDGTSLIKSDWVDRCKSEVYDIQRTRPQNVKALYLGVDFAFSDRILADKSVFWSWAEIELDGKTKYLLLDVETKKGWSGQEQMDYINELHKTYHYDLIALEENSIKAISKNIKTDYGNLPIKRFWTGTNDEKQETTDKYKEYTTVGKRNLILRLGTSLENKEIILPYKSKEARDKVEQFKLECVSFAQEEGKLTEIGVHPDMPIAAAYGLEVAKRWGNSFFIT
jgi:hypothetical protein